MTQDQAPAVPAEDPPAAHAHLRRAVLLGILAVVVLVAAIVVIQQLGGTDRFGSLDQASGAWAYLTVFFLVFGDAICALFPGETTLNTASALAAGAR